MQLIERSVVGLRSARHVFHHNDTGVSVTLFPMVHVGEAAFFDAVYSDALAHDVVLAEGISSPIVTRITRSYRWVEHAGLDLVVQPRLPDALKGSARIITADLSQDEFEAAWRALPLPIRAMTAVFVPLVAIQRRFLRSRSALSRNLSMNVLKDRSDILGMSAETAGFSRLLLDTRDARLIACLDQVLGDAGETAPRIAIIYGAEHMRAVVPALLERQFVLRGSDWLTVFSHD